MSHIGRLCLSLQFAIPFAIWTTIAQAADPEAGVFATLDEAKADPDFLLQGEYAATGLGVQVVALGDGQFSVVTYRGGLPGAGFDGVERQEQEEDVAGVRQLIEQARLHRVERASPSLDAPPPEEAIVLFDGTRQSLKTNWQDGARLTDDRSLVQGCTTQETFQDFVLHVEFRLPYMPNARSQARGNSGLYLQGRYELQMLDSFGLEGKQNECGGLYSVKDPDVNMCLPPLAWQTYDVEFTAPRFDAQGAKVSPAQVTARLNGVLVHSQVEVPGPTTAAPLAEGPEAGPIYLQDHGNPVTYRNIWLVKRDAQRESQRPIVPGFERFHASAAATMDRGGTLLLGELGCVACHAAPEPLASGILERTAPILDKVGQRVQPAWLIDFLTDPQAAKPGTTMPNVLASLTAGEREEAAADLTHLLLSTGITEPEPGDRQSALRGEQQFHTVGCTACHAPRNGHRVTSDTTIPLIGVERKYTISSLAEFLKNPLESHPAARMPAFGLSDEQARDLSCYFIDDAQPADPAPQPPFVYDPVRAARGLERFRSLGCASCHALHVEGERLAPLNQNHRLTDLDPLRGCLAVSPNDEPTQAAPVPDYVLSWAQRSALRTTLRTLSGGTAEVLGIIAAMPEPRIEQTLAAFNCYACHSRGGIGGPEPDRNALFVTSIPEMGDEGRVPPPLDGVGDKLNDNWLREVLENGAHDRLYMLARMPRFGGAAVGHLAADLIEVDRRTEARIVKPDENMLRVKSTGRHLVGDKALACVKCHVFGSMPATGIQALDLQTITRRVRDDWFHRYMIDPAAYRPGTRMPTGFPEGKGTIHDVYDGDPARQISAMWTYLADGAQAGIPDGLLAGVIELEPKAEPIIYRNFLEGLTPRGIGVGYPEHVNLAWDANRMCLALAWHGRFFDASMHWSGRGSGFQRPLGDHILKLESTAPLASLETPDTPWPDGAPRDRGYKFLGYRLDDAKRPRFAYRVDGLHVVDFAEPIPRSDNEGSFLRHLSIVDDGKSSSMYFRAASGATIVAEAEGWYLVDGLWRVRVGGTGIATPQLRESAGIKELLVKIVPSDGKAEVVQEIVW